MGKEKCHTCSVPKFGPKDKRYVGGSKTIADKTEYAKKMEKVILSGRK